MTMLRIASCRICAVGNVGIRISGSGACVAMCDDCDAIWTDPNLHDGPYLSGDPQVTGPAGGASLRERPARWAGREEAERVGWSSHIIEETAARDAACGHAIHRSVRLGLAPARARAMHAPRAARPGASPSAAGRR